MADGPQVTGHEVQSSRAPRGEWPDQSLHLTRIDASGIGRGQERIISKAREQIEALAL